MIVGIVSDTHGRIGAAHMAAELLAQFSPIAVLHCGDVGAPEVVEEFATWPTHFVVGNVDEGDSQLAAAIRHAGQSFHGHFADLTIVDRRIAIVHGHDRRRLEAAIASGLYDLVCTGHTHQAETRRVGNTLIVNPGALHRAAQHTIATVDLITMTATHHVIK